MFFDKRVEHVWISIYAPKHKEDVELEKNPQHQSSCAYFQNFITFHKFIRFN